MKKDYRDYSQYCSCGAQHGTIDGSYRCTDNCLASYLAEHPEKEKDYLDDLKN